MEGKTDIKYRTEGQLSILGHEDVLEVVDVKDGNGLLNREKYRDEGPSPI